MSVSQNWENYGKAKVKQSLYRPGESQEFPGGWVSQITRHSDHDGGKVVSPKHRPPPPPPHSKIFLVLISVREWVDPMAIMRPEGLWQWKAPLTPWRIEPATFWIVAQCLNQLRHRVTGENYDSNYYSQRRKKTPKLRWDSDQWQDRRPQEYCFCGDCYFRLHCCGSYHWEVHFNNV
jgi:hypothetical protein